MPQIAYQGQKYDVLDPWEEWTRPEASFIKKKTGLRIAEVMDDAVLSDPDAICALLYVAKKRAGEKVTWADFDDFRIGQCEFIGDEDGSEGESDDAEEQPPEQGRADPTASSGTTRTRGSSTTSTRSRSSSGSTRGKSTS